MGFFLLHVRNIHCLRNDVFTLSKIFYTIRGLLQINWHIFFFRSHTCKHVQCTILFEATLSKIPANNPVEWKLLKRKFKQWWSTIQPISYNKRLHLTSNHWTK